MENRPEYVERLWENSNHVKSLQELGFNVGAPDAYCPVIIGYDE